MDGAVPSGLLRFLAEGGSGWITLFPDYEGGCHVYYPYNMGMYRSASSPDVAAEQIKRAAAVFVPSSIVEVASYTECTCIDVSQGDCEPEGECTLYGPHLSEFAEGRAKFAVCRVRDAPDLVAVLKIVSERGYVCPRTVRPIVRNIFDTSNWTRIRPRRDRMHAYTAHTATGKVVELQFRDEESAKAVVSVCEQAIDGRLGRA